MSSAFRDRVSIVTGASGGIGEQIALQLAARGAKVVLAARRVEELRRVAEACRELALARGYDGTDRVLTMPTDLADSGACERLVVGAIARFGQIDMLVNNAGLGMWARADAVRDSSVFQHVMAVNYFGVVHCTLHALPHLKETRGRIVCVSSLAGLTGVPFRSGYSASKHAVHGFLDSLRIELRDSGVTVTLVCPGWVATGTQARNLGADGSPLGAMPVSLTGAMTAERCAAITLKAAERRRREVVISARAKFGLWLRLVAPDFVDGMTARIVKRGR